MRGEWETLGERLFGVIWLALVLAWLAAIVWIARDCTVEQACVYKTGNPECKQESAEP